MMQVINKHNQAITVPVDFEVNYTALSGNSTIIPMSYDWKTLAIQVSGGLDSTLLLYLTATTIQKHSLKVRILPISMEVQNKAKNLGSARKIISRVSELLNFDQWETPLEIIMTAQESVAPLKNKFFNDTLVGLHENNKIQFEFNGNTKNPPEEVRKLFKNDIARQVTRDDRTTIYNGPFSASPHALMTKHDIINLYIQHGIINDLTEYTLSCDENLSFIKENSLPTPCRQCWWCSEREWGFTSNGLTIDDAHKFTE